MPDSPVSNVRMVRFELTQANAHYPLKVACLPFHHIRKNTFGDCKIIYFRGLAKTFADFFNIFFRFNKYS